MPPEGGIEQRNEEVGVAWEQEDGWERVSKGEEGVRVVSSTCSSGLLPNYSGKICILLNDATQKNRT